MSVTSRLYCCAIDLPFIRDLNEALIVPSQYVTSRNRRRNESQREGKAMFFKIMSVAATAGLLVSPVAARADDAVGAAIAGAFIGAAVASGVPVEQRQPLRQYVVRERPRSYVYEEELAVGREFRYGPYGTQEVPPEYGVAGHHYAVVNNRAVIFHPHTRRIVHVYDPYED
jgi:hypothetical protein